MREDKLLEVDTGRGEPLRLSDIIEGARIAYEEEQGNALTPAKLTLALARMVEKLAEARREELDQVMEQVKEGKAGLWRRLNEAGEWTAEMEARVDGLASLPSDAGADAPTPVITAKEIADRRADCAVVEFAFHDGDMWRYRSNNLEIRSVYAWRHIQPAPPPEALCAP